VSLQHDGRSRRYLIHVPAHADPSAPRPVVLVLHGAADDAVDNRDWLGLDDMADREGFLAVYPDGTGPFAGRLHMWNSGDCCGSAQWNGVDDVGFLLAVLDDVSERTAVDATRVYATGLSNGAMMAYRLAAEASDRIAPSRPSRARAPPRSATASARCR
jgi:polyhydroxybutyrate depolymerase